MHRVVVLFLLAFALGSTKVDRAEAADCPNSVDLSNSCTISTDGSSQTVAITIEGETTAELCSLQDCLATCAGFDENVPVNKFTITGLGPEAILYCPSDFPVLSLSSGQSAELSSLSVLYHQHNPTIVHAEDAKSVSVEDCHFRLSQDGDEVSEAANIDISGPSTTVSVKHSRWLARISQPAAFDTDKATRALRVHGSNVIVEDCEFHDFSISAIDQVEGKLTIETSVFDHCSSLQGGAVSSREATEVNIGESSFDSCHALDEGGALYLQVPSEAASGEYELLGNTFTSCTALNEDTSGDGGAIAIKATNISVEYNVLVEQCEFDSCSAESGGAISLLDYGLSNVLLEVSKSAFLNCKSTYNGRLDRNAGGGAIAARLYNSRVKVSTSIFSNCTAIEGAGGSILAIDVQGLEISESAIVRSSIQSESSISSVAETPTGGAIAVDNRNFDLRSEVHVNNTLLRDSSSPFSGGNAWIAGVTKVFLNDNVMSGAKSGAGASIVVIPEEGGEYEVKDDYFCNNEEDDMETSIDAVYASVFEFHVLDGFSTASTYAYKATHASGKASGSCFMGDFSVDGIAVSPDDTNMTVSGDVDRFGPSEDCIGHKCDAKAPEFVCPSDVPPGPSSPSDVVSEIQTKLCYVPPSPYTDCDSLKDASSVQGTTLEIDIAGDTPVCNLLSTCDLSTFSSSSFDRVSLKSSFASKVFCAFSQPIATLDGSLKAFSLDGVTVEYMAHRDVPVVHASSGDLILNNVNVDSSINSGSAVDFPLLAIEGSANLQVTESEFSTSDRSAIVVSTSGSVSVTRSSFTDFTTSAVVVHEDSSLTIESTTFTNCRSERGGAIELDMAEDLTITDSNFVGCEATGKIGGGAIFVNPNINGETSLSVSKSRFDGCRATEGGAIAVMSFSAEHPVNVDVTDTEFDSCFAMSGGAISLLDYGISNLNLDITNSAFMNCRSEADDGLLNRSGGGGAIASRVYSAAVTVDGSIFSNCSSSEGAGGAIFGIDLKGLTVENSAFFDAAMESDVSLSKNDKIPTGGAIAVENRFNDYEAEVRISETVFQGCSSSFAGANVWIAGFAKVSISSNAMSETLNEIAGGGAIVVIQKDGADANSVTIENSNFCNNEHSNMKSIMDVSSSSLVNYQLTDNITTSSTLRFASNTVSGTTGADGSCFSGNIDITISDGTSQQLTTHLEGDVDNIGPSSDCINYECELKVPDYLCKSGIAIGPSSASQAVSAIQTQLCIVPPSPYTDCDALKTKSSVQGGILVVDVDEDIALCDVLSVCDLSSFTSATFTSLRFKSSSSKTLICPFAKPFVAIKDSSLVKDVEFEGVNMKYVSYRRVPMIHAITGSVKLDTVTIGPSGKVSSTTDNPLVLAEGNAEIELKDVSFTESGHHALKSTSSGPTTIKGSSFSDLTSTAVVVTSEDGSLHVESSTFVNCQGQRGGAIDLEIADVTISSSSFKGCEASGSIGGGAIFIAPSKSTDSLKIEDNHFEACAAIDGNGGAIAISGKDEITSEFLVIDNYFESCLARTGGAIGFISSPGQSELTVDHSLFQDCHAICAGSVESCVGLKRGGGGAIATRSESLSIVISNSYFVDSSATNGAGGSVFIDNALNALVRNSLFSNITVPFVGSVSDDESKTPDTGGAIAISSTGVTRASIRNNAFVNTESAYQGESIWLDGCISSSVVSNTFTREVSEKEQNPAEAVYYRPRTGNSIKDTETFQLNQNRFCQDYSLSDNVTLLDTVAKMLLYHDVPENHYVQSYIFVRDTYVAGAIAMNEREVSCMVYDKVEISEDIKSGANTYTTSSGITAIPSSSEIVPPDYCQSSHECELTNVDNLCPNGSPIGPRGLVNMAEADLVATQNNLCEKPPSPFTNCSAIFDTAMVAGGYLYLTPQSDSGEPITACDIFYQCDIPAPLLNAKTLVINGGQNQETLVCGSYRPILGYIPPQFKSIAFQNLKIEVEPDIAVPVITVGSNINLDMNNVKMIQREGIVGKRTSVVDLHDSATLTAQSLSFERPTGTGTRFGRSFVHSTSVGKVTITNSEFEHFSISPIILENGALQAVGNTFKACKSELSGGAIHFDSSKQDLTVENSEFSSCDSEQEGGAIYSANGYSTLIQMNTFVNSEASVGGAIKVFQVSKVEITTNKFQSSIASVGGSIEVQESGKVVIDGSLFDSSEAEDGGALSLISNVETVVTESYFIDMSAQRGGAIYAKECHILDAMSLYIKGTASKTEAAEAIYTVGVFNVTFDDNIVVSLGDGGFITSEGSSNVIVTNSLFTAENPSVSSESVFNFNQVDELTIRTNVIQHSMGDTAGIIVEEVLKTNIVDNTISGIGKIRADGPSQHGSGDNRLSFVDNRLCTSPSLAYTPSDSDELLDFFELNAESGVYLDANMENTFLSGVTKTSDGNYTCHRFGNVNSRIIFGDNSFLPYFNARESIPSVVSADGLSCDNDMVCKQYSNILCGFDRAGPGSCNILSLDANLGFVCQESFIKQSQICQGQQIEGTAAFPPYPVSPFAGTWSNDGIKIKFDLESGSLPQFFARSGSSLNFDQIQTEVKSLVAGQTCNLNVVKTLFSTEDYNKLQPRECEYIFEKEAYSFQFSIELTLSSLSTLVPSDDITLKTDTFYTPDTTLRGSGDFTTTLRPKNPAPSSLVTNIANFHGGKCGEFQVGTIQPKGFGGRELIYSWTFVAYNLPTELLGGYREVDIDFTKLAKKNIDPIILNSTTPYLNVPFNFLGTVAFDDGVYEVTVSAENYLEEIIVSASSPLIRISPGETALDQATIDLSMMPETIQRSDKLTVLPAVERPVGTIECNVNILQNYSLVYEWTIVDASNNNAVLFNDGSSTLYKRNFDLAPRTLEVGKKYVFQIKAFWQHSNGAPKVFTNQQSHTLEVVSTPLSSPANFKTSYTVYVPGANDDATSVSLSVADVIDFDEDNLLVSDGTYSWSRLTTSLVPQLDKQLEQAAGPKLDLKVEYGSTENEDMIYAIQATVESRGRSIKLIFDVKLILDAPLVEVELKSSQCRTTAGGCIVNRGDVISIVPVMSVPYGDMSSLEDVTYAFNWTESTDMHLDTNLIPTQSLTLSEPLRIDTSLLPEEERKYDFQFQVTSIKDGQETISADTFSFSVNLGPKGGKCTISPDSGEAMSTIFIMDCSGFDPFKLRLYSLEARPASNPNAPPISVFQSQFSPTNIFKMYAGTFTFRAIVSDINDAAYVIDPVSTDSGSTTINVAKPGGIGGGSDDEEYIENLEKDVKNELKDGDLSDLSGKVDELLNNVDSTDVAGTITQVVDGMKDVTDVGSGSGTTSEAKDVLDVLFVLSTKEIDEFTSVSSETVGDMNDLFKDSMDQLIEDAVSNMDNDQKNDLKTNEVLGEVAVISSKLMDIGSESEDMKKSFKNLGQAVQGVLKTAPYSEFRSDYMQSGGAHVKSESVSISIDTIEYTTFSLQQGSQLSQVIKTEAFLSDGSSSVEVELPVQFNTKDTSPIRSQDAAVVAISGDIASKIFPVPDVTENSLADSKVVSPLVSLISMDGQNVNDISDQTTEVRFTVSVEQNKAEIQCRILKPDFTGELVWDRTLCKTTIGGSFIEQQVTCSCSGEGSIAVIQEGYDLPDYTTRLTSMQVSNDLESVRVNMESGYLPGAIWPSKYDKVTEAEARVLVLQLVKLQQCQLSMIEAVFDEASWNTLEASSCNFDVLEDGSGFQLILDIKVANTAQFNAGDTFRLLRSNWAIPDGSYRSDTSDIVLTLAAPSNALAPAITWKVPALSDKLCGPQTLADITSTSGLGNRLVDYVWIVSVYKAGENGLTKAQLQNAVDNGFSTNIVPLTPSSTTTVTQSTLALILDASEMPLDALYRLTLQTSNFVGQSYTSAPQYLIRLAAPTAGLPTPSVQLGRSTASVSGTYGIDVLATVAIPTRTQVCGSVSVSDYLLKYAWTVTDSSQDVVAQSFGSTLSVDPFILTPGDYEVSLALTWVPKANEKSVGENAGTTSMTVTIESPPIMTIPTPPPIITFPSPEPVIIQLPLPEVSITTPDEPSPAPAPEWFCSGECPDPIQEAIDEANAKEEDTISIPTIDLDDNFDGTIVVGVNQTKGDGTQVTREVPISVKPKDQTPLVQVYLPDPQPCRRLPGESSTCVVNQGETVLINPQLSYPSDKKAADIESTKFTWTETNYGLEKQLTSYDWSKAGAVQLDTSSLNAGQTYNFRVQVNATSNGVTTSSESEISFILNRSPFGGACVVDQSTGVYLSTDFRVSCVNWKSSSANTDLRYTFRYRREGVSSNSFSTFKSALTDSSATTKLPFGVYEIVAIIQDGYQAYTIVEPVPTSTGQSSITVLYSEPVVDGQPVQPTPASPEEIKKVAEDIIDSGVKTGNVDSVATGADTLLDETKDLEGDAKESTVVDATSKIVDSLIGLSDKATEEEEELNPTPAPTPAPGGAPTPAPAPAPVVVPDPKKVLDILKNVADANKDIKPDLLPDQVDDLSGIADTAVNEVLRDIEEAIMIGQPVPVINGPELISQITDINDFLIRSDDVAGQDQTERLLEQVRKTVDILDQTGDSSQFFDEESGQSTVETGHVDVVLKRDGYVPEDFDDEDNPPVQEVEGPSLPPSSTGIVLPPPKVKVPVIVKPSPQPINGRTEVEQTVIVVVTDPATADDTAPYDGEALGAPTVTSGPVSPKIDLCITTSDDPSCYSTDDDVDVEIVLPIDSDIRDQIDIPDQEPTSKLECAVFNAVQKTWDSSVCTTGVNNDGTVTCSCNRMGPTAVLQIGTGVPPYVVDPTKAIFGDDLKTMRLDLLTGTVPRPLWVGRDLIVASSSGDAVQPFTAVCQLEHIAALFAASEWAKLDATGCSYEIKKDGGTFRLSVIVSLGQQATIDTSLQLKIQPDELTTVDGTSRDQSELSPTVQIDHPESLENLKLDAFVPKTSNSNCNKALFGEIRSKVGFSSDAVFTWTITEHAVPEKVEVDDLPQTREAAGAELQSETATGLRVEFAVNDISANALYMISVSATSLVGKTVEAGPFPMLRQQISAGMPAEATIDLSSSIPDRLAISSTLKAIPLIIKPERTTFCQDSSVVDDYFLTYSWSLDQLLVDSLTGSVLPDSNVVTLDSSLTDKRDLVLPPLSLSANNLYEVKLTLSWTPKPSADSSLSVVPAGTATRRFETYRTPVNLPDPDQTEIVYMEDDTDPNIAIDLGATDPDNPAQGGLLPYDADVEWSCSGSCPKEVEEALEQASENDDTSIYIPLEPDNTDADFEIDVEIDVDGEISSTSYPVEIKKETPAVEVELKSASCSAISLQQQQLCEVNQGNSLRIRPVLSIPSGADLSTIDGLVYKYTWTESLHQLEQSLALSSVDWSSDSGLVVDTSEMTPQTYKFEVLVETFSTKLGTSSTSKSSLVVRINSAPKPGTCKVSPDAGEPLVSPFTISCTDWSDDTSSAFTYKFQYRNIDVPNSPFVTFQAGSANSLASIVLPEGRFEFVAHAIDEQGAATKYAPVPSYTNAQFVTVESVSSGDAEQDLNNLIDRAEELVEESVEESDSSTLVGAVETLLQNGNSAELDSVLGTLLDAVANLTSGDSSSGNEDEKSSSSDAQTLLNLLKNAANKGSQTVEENKPSPTPAPTTPVPTTPFPTDGTTPAPTDPATVAPTPSPAPTQPPVIQSPTLDKTKEVLEDLLDQVKDVVNDDEDSTPVSLEEVIEDTLAVDSFLIESSGSNNDGTQSNYVDAVRDHLLPLIEEGSSFSDGSQIVDTTNSIEKSTETVGTVVDTEYVTPESPTQTVTTPVLKDDSQLLPVDIEVPYVNDGGIVNPIDDPKQTLLVVSFKPDVVADSFPTDPTSNLDGATAVAPIVDTNVVGTEKSVVDSTLNQNQDRVIFDFKLKEVDQPGEVLVCASWQPLYQSWTTSQCYTEVKTSSNNEYGKDVQCQCSTVNQVTVLRATLATLGEVPTPPTPAPTTAPPPTPTPAPYVPPPTEFVAPVYPITTGIARFADDLSVLEIRFDTGLMPKVEGTTGLDPVPKNLGAQTVKPLVQVCDLSTLTRIFINMDMSTVSSCSYKVIEGSNGLFQLEAHLALKSSASILPGDDVEIDRSRMITIDGSIPFSSVLKTPILSPLNPVQPSITVENKPVSRAVCNTEDLGYIDSAQGFGGRAVSYTWTVTPYFLPPSLTNENLFTLDQMTFQPVYLNVPQTVDQAGNAIDDPLQPLEKGNRLEIGVEEMMDRALYFVRVEATNFVGDSVAVEYPIVRLIPEADSLPGVAVSLPSAPSAIHQSDELVLDSQYATPADDAECTAASSAFYYDLKPTWTIKDKDTGSTVFSSTNVQLVVPAGTLTVGQTFHVNLALTWVHKEDDSKPNELAGSTDAMIEVLPAPLKKPLTPPPKVTVEVTPSTSPIQLDASVVYDPDLSNGPSAAFSPSVTWTCQYFCPAGLKAQLNAASLSDAKIANLDMTFSTLSLSDDQEVTITALVEDSGRSLSISWTLNMVLTLPDLTVKVQPSTCRVVAEINSDVDCILNSNEQLRLSSTVLHVDGSSDLSTFQPTYQWREINHDLHLSPAFADVDWTTSGDLLIQTNRLDDTKTYEFQLEVAISTDSATNEAQASATISINPIPFLGQCNTITPSITAIQDKAQLICSGWIDDNLLAAYADPALLSVVGLRYTVGTQLLTPDRDQPITYLDTSRDPIQLFDMGQAGEYLVYVRIEDVYGGAVEVLAPTTANTQALTVEPIPDDLPVEQVQEQAVSENNQQLIVSILENKVSKNPGASGASTILNDLEVISVGLEVNGNTVKDKVILDTLLSMKSTFGVGEALNEEDSAKASLLIKKAIDAMIAQPPTSKVIADQKISGVLGLESFVVEGLAKTAGTPPAKDVCMAEQPKCGRVRNVRNSLGSLLQAMQANALTGDTAFHTSDYVSLVLVSNTYVQGADNGMQVLDLEPLISAAGLPSSTVARMPKKILVPPLVLRDVAPGDTMPRTQTMYAVLFHDEGVNTCFDVGTGCLTEDVDIYDMNSERTTLGNGVIDICHMTPDNVCESLNDLDPKINIAYAFEVDPSIQMDADEIQVPLCAYWDRSSSKWSEEGMETGELQENGQTYVTCKANHLTEFTVLRHVVFNGLVGEVFATDSEIAPIRFLYLVSFIVYASLLLIMAWLAHYHFNPKQSETVVQVSGYIRTVAIVSMLAIFLRALQSIVIYVVLTDETVLYSYFQLSLFSASSTFLVVFIMDIIFRALEKVAVDMAKLEGLHEQLVVKHYKQFFNPLIALLALISLLVAALPLFIKSISDEDAKPFADLLAYVSIIVGTIFVLGSEFLAMSVFHPEHLAKSNYKTIYAAAEVRCRRIRNAAIVVSLLLVARGVIMLVATETAVLTIFHIACDGLAVFMVIELYYPTIRKLVDSKLNSGEKAQLAKVTPAARQ
jgi:hypothetical protein